MPNSESGLARTAWPRFPLTLKLVLALASVIVIMLLFLFLYFGPHTTESFLQRSQGLIAMSSDEMRTLVRHHTTESTELLVEINRHRSDSRQRELQDLPLSLYRGDVRRIRAAISQHDSTSSRRLEANVDILAKEMERRALSEVDRRLEDLVSAQTEMGDAFAVSLRRSFLLLSGGVLAGLVLLLGFGLYHTVIDPVRRLRRITQSVTKGDLQIDVSIRSRDEVGDLASDFSAMLAELRSSREAVRQKNLELEELNRNLESEVARKTEHLETALDDLRSAQKQLLHAEKMASIGKLAGGVAHEFNNLIGGISGCAHEILETESDPERRETLEVIQRATRKASQITDQLLRFSRQRALNVNPIRLSKVLDEALLLIEADARKRGVRIGHELDKDLIVTADADALHQVFLNLCTNALQAMINGGQLSITAETAPREIALRFSDTGVGIPKENLDRVFEPFFTTKDQENDPFLKGSGLGLAVCYSIVEAHGGTISASSEPGEGATITVRLPRQPPITSTEDAGSPA